MRESVALECSVCKRRNYRTSVQTRGGVKLGLKKYCRFCGKHTVHNSRRR